MAEPTRRKKWSDVEARLEALDRKGLVSLLGDLYDANVSSGYPSMRPPPSFLIFSTASFIAADATHLPR